MLATSADGVARDDGVFHLVGRLPFLDGPLFYVLLPARVRRLVREHRPDAIVTQSPYEAALVRRVTGDARLVVELHGDWRTAPRLYGSPLRRLLAPVTDRVGAWGVRHADAVRTISAFTTGLVRGLGREPDAEFAAFTDLDAFTGERVPVPSEPRLLFVGVLERYKNIEVLAEAWRLVAARRPDARLHLVGSGTQEAVAEAPRPRGRRMGAPDRRYRGRRGDGPCPRASAPVGVRRACRGSRSRRSCAAARWSAPARAVSPTSSRTASTACWFHPGSARALANAIERILDDDELAASLGAAAADSAARWVATPTDYADRVAALVGPSARARR